MSPPAPDVKDAPRKPRLLDDSWRDPLARQIADWLRIFVQDGQVVELRALKVEREGGYPATWSGYFDSSNLESMARAAVDLTALAEGVYFTLNPLDGALLARRYNKIEPAKDTATDADVLKRRWLLVDADPVRKSGISASDAEKQLAWRKMREVHAWLQDQGWPDPVLADSGNGYHLLYRIDLPSDDGGLVKGVLEALAESFDDDRVKIDTKVANPARIVKLYGTVARKGDSISQRPHRRAAVLAQPEEVLVVSQEQLQAVGATASRKSMAVNRAAPIAPRNTVLAGSRAELLVRARSYLQKVPPAVSGQGGHNQTFKVACILVQRFGLSEEEALSVIGEWNETCQPPWSEKELRKKLRDATEGAGARQGLVGGMKGPKGSDGEGEFDPALPAAREAPDDPHRLARIFLDRTRTADGVATVRCWNGEWYRWEAGAYRRVADGELTAEMNAVIKEEFDRLNVMQQFVAVDLEIQEQAKSGLLARTRKVTATVVNNAIQALRAQTIVKGGVEPPAWLDGAEPLPAREVVPARNALVHLPALMEGRDCLTRLTPRLFTTVALDYEIDPTASQPRGWLAFLDELWPGDPQSVELLQEWFGYCLTQDTSQQKMLLVIGPKRAGKGTIARVLTALVGQANVAGPTLGSLAGNFGLSQLMGKPVAIISDARFSGRSSEQAMVVERLLSISGEDTLTIDRKNREHLTVKLPCRFMILTNELPRLNDASAALPSRLLVLQLTRSWYGQEDMELAQRVLQERGGIFLWAVEGLKRLCTRRRFVQPESGVETARRLVELSSPVTAFVQDRCELGTEKNVAKRTLFDEWRRWCNESGHEPGSVATFGRNLMAAFPEIQSSRPREAGGRVNSYSGIGLRRL